MVGDLLRPQLARDRSWPGSSATGSSRFRPPKRSVGWRDLFAINFTFFLNPVMMVLGALAVLESGLPLLWRSLNGRRTVARLPRRATIAAQPGVDDGLPGQVAMRAPFGRVGARGLTSPYRVIASTYWFAAQALTAAFGIQAIAGALAYVSPPLVPTALAIAVVQAAVAVLGFNVMRWLLRDRVAALDRRGRGCSAIWLASDDPSYAVGRVLDSPEQAADVGRLRDGRDRDVRLVADARHEHRAPSAATRGRAATCGSGS